MLYWLLYEKLYAYFSPFRIFQYVTFRVAFASLTALFLCIALGPWLIGRLRQFQIGQHIREDGPQGHKSKAGTPTMGGVLIIISIIVPTLLWTNLSNVYVWIAMLGLVMFGAIGFVDDYSKVKKQRNLGLTGWRKFGLQCAVSAFLGMILLHLHGRGLYSTSMNVPFFKQVAPDMLLDSFLHNPLTYPLAFLPFFLFLILIIAGMSNAVNLTDGLDGLAIGLMIISAGALTILSYVSGHRAFSEYLGIVRLPGAAELSIFCGATTGASIGFLYYNAHPAEIFMGDVGSLSLGGCLALIAVMIKQELLLPFIGGVYVIEALSVILQVGSYKLRHKRIFKMAPIHHHFEALGWQEAKVITRFWIAGLVLALFALTTLKLR